MIFIILNNVKFKNVCLNLLISMKDFLLKLHHWKLLAISVI